MSANINNQILTDYLLGKLSDENLLDQIEDRLSIDKDFSQQLEIIEDDLIEQYINSKIKDEDLKQFEKFYLNSETRRKNIDFIKALKQYSLEHLQENDLAQENVERQGRIWDWLNFSPKLAFGLSLSLILIIAFGFVFFMTKSNQSNNYIAQIDSLYTSNRPIQARIVDFKYLPHSPLRGAEDDTDGTKKRKRRIIETKLLEAVEADTSSENLNNLGVFYLTEGKFDVAIEQFSEALSKSEKNSEVRSNLSVALLEKANIAEEPDERLKLLAKAFEQTTKAINEGDKRIELFFNKALILQQMNVPGQAIEAWKIYLEMDKDSKWAEEARKNLIELESKKNANFKTREAILEDFMAAYKKKDFSLAWKIHSQTKELNSQKFIPLQLTLSYLTAIENKNKNKAETYLSALDQIGQLERKKNADVFFYDLAKYYKKLEPNQEKILLQSHQTLNKALELLLSAKYKEANQKLVESKRLFESVGDDLEAKVLEVPIAFTLTRLGKLNESNQILKNLEKFAREKKYKWLLTACLDWISSNQSIENDRSKAIATANETLRLAEETENVYEIQRMSGGLSQIYYEFGETSNSLKNISRAIEFGDLYNQSYLQAWRNLKHGSELFNVLGFNESSVAFGNEFVNLAKESKSNPALIQLSQLLLAQAYYEKKDYQRTLELIEESKISESSNDDNFQQNAHLALSLLIKAHVRRRQGNCTEALKLYDESIAINNKLSTNMIETYIARKGKLLCYQATDQEELLQTELDLVLKLFENRRTQIVEESYRNVFFDNEQTVYDIAIDFYLKKNDEKKAFEYSEKSKSRSLLDFLQNGATITKDNITYNAVAEPLSLDKIQHRMPQDVQLIQYAVLPNKIVAWVITKNGFEKVETEISSEELDKKIGDYLKTLKERRNKIDQIKFESQQLYKILIDPLLIKLDKEKETFIIADKALHRLPLASLYSERNKRYFIEDFIIANTPSATIFIITTENAQKKETEESLISIGDPAFDRTENPGLDELRSAKKEATEVAGFYLNNEQLIGKKATKENFLKNFDRATIVHFAGHYVANERSPLNSKLLLSKTNDSQQSDLRVIEIAKRKQNKLKLVILSACQTDVERYYKGEGSIGAARIFLAIGSPVVVASHFEVDSEATADLMINFHRLRKDRGLSVINALREAQIEAIRNESLTKRSPFYWLAFSTIGGFSRY